MENYSSNSNRSKTGNNTQNEEVKVQSVVSNPVTVKKKSKTQKFADVFIKEDFSNVVSYAVTDIVVPTVKRMIYDAFTDGLDMMLNGGEGRRYRGNSRTGTQYSYNKAYSRASYQQQPRTTVKAGSGLEFDNILFADRGDAERVLMELDEALSRYDIVSVQDYYSAAGLTCPYTYNSWGWEDLRAADVIRARDADGYYIKLPRPQPINK